eukprot:422207-Alexandrium_andersonii.AAC.1
MIPQQLRSATKWCPSRSVTALSPTVWHPFGRGSDGAPVSLCGGVRPCPRGDSVIVARPPYRLSPSCTDLPNTHAERAAS